jgi:hypothetical protein
LIRLLKAGGDRASSLAAAFAEPSLATRKNASNDRKGGNLRMDTPVTLLQCNIIATLCLAAVSHGLAWHFYNRRLRSLQL